MEVALLPEIELELTLRELYGSIGKEVFSIPTNVELEIRPNIFSQGIPSISINMKR